MIFWKAQAMLLFAAQQVGDMSARASVSACNRALGTSTCCTYPIHLAAQGCASCDRGIDDEVTLIFSLRSFHGDWTRK